MNTDQSRPRPPSILSLLIFAIVYAVALSLVVVGASAQDLRAPAAPGDAPVTVTTRVRHVTTVVLPESESIVDVVVGDAEQWDVSASAHMAFIRPLADDARSNLVLLTAAGAVVPLLLVEKSDTEVDAVVRIVSPGPAAAPGPEASGPVLATSAAVTAMAVRAAEAWEAVAAAETRAAERVAAARTAAQAELDAKREAYARQLDFDYRWARGTDPTAWPWLVEGLWHDGQHTYLRTRATNPVLYEQVDGEIERVAVAEVLEEVVHVVPRVLGAGVLEVGGERRAWTVEPRETGP